MLSRVHPAQCLVPSCMHAFLKYLDDSGRPGLRSGEGTLALSPEQIRSLPQCELAALWKDYVNALTGLLQVRTLLTSSHGELY